jgi:hypothetical protein
MARTLNSSRHPSRSRCLSPALGTILTALALLTSACGNSDDHAERPSPITIDPPSPTAAGDLAAVHARVPASVACAIQFTRPSGRVSTAAGLETKRSDEAGDIAWQFRVSNDTRPGIGTIEVRCGVDSATVPIEIVPATSTSTAPAGPGLPPLTIEVTGNALGATARAIAHTAPGVECVIAAFAPSGAKLSVPGLEPRSTDADGEARWEWTIPKDMPEGQGAVTIACGGATASAPYVAS